MVINDNVEINSTAIILNLRRLTNQIYKLLPSREENLDWETPLSTIIEEFSGMSYLLISQQEILFSLLCKLHGLKDLKEENDFYLYRRTIFECLNLISTLKGNVIACQD